MKKKIAQFIADGILVMLENSKSDKSFLFYLDMGLWFDEFCIDVLDIELD